MQSIRIEFLKSAFTRKILVIWAVALATFGTFMITALCWGGAALNGKIEDGKYYLGQNSKFQEVGRGYYATSAALSMIWPPAFLLAISRLLPLFPGTPDVKKLKVFLLIFFSIIAASFSIASLVCLVKVFADVV